MNFQLMTFRKELSVLGLHSMFYYEHGKDFYFAGERHDFWEMVYVDQGRASVVAENTGYLIEQGEVIFHKPMEFHTLASAKKEPHNVIVISFSAVGEALRFFENQILTVHSNQKKILSDLLLEIQNTFGVTTDIIHYKKRLKEKSRVVGAQQLVINYLEQFLISLIRENETGESRQGRKSARAKKNVEHAMAESIEAYLSQSLYEKLTLNQIAKKFHVGKSYLSQIFKEATGKSVMTYYLDLKIAEAKRLLRKDELNCSQIAEKLGYATVHNFSRTFKMKTGFSPSGYQYSVKR